MKKLLVSSAIVLLLVTGCGKVPKLQDGKDAVASLNNGGISVDDLYEEMKNTYALNVLINMTDEKILNEKYQKTDEEKTYVDNMVSQTQMYYQYFYSNSFSSYEAFILDQYQARNVDELKEKFTLDYRRNLAIKDYAKSLITDKEIKDYYDKEVVGDMKASHILITADYKDNATDDEKKAAEEAALTKANELITKLNNGEDFATLAKENSKDGSASNGGDVGFFNDGDMEEEFYEACKALEVGKYTTMPVKTQYGYHIILKTEQKEKDTLDNWKEKITDKLAEEKQTNDSDFSTKALIKIREQSGLKINDKELEKQYENYKYNFQ